jgi:hypothetical protein
MTIRQFVSDLGGMGKGELQCKSLEWHEDLAEALLEADIENLRSSIKSIRLVPLRDGSYV